MQGTFPRVGESEGNCRSRESNSGALTPSAPPTGCTGSEARWARASPMGSECGYVTLTTKTHRALPASFDSLSATVTGAPKTVSKLSFW